MGLCVLCLRLLSLLLRLRLVERSIGLGRNFGARSYLLSQVLVTSLPVMLYLVHALEEALYEMINRLE